MNSVIVVGGGASGLVSAIMAARKGAKVTILEKASSCGKKILATGNGKCNYYNEDMSIKHYNSEDISMLPKIINTKNKNIVLEFFNSIGVIARVKNGYYYPYSNQAISILNALLVEIKKLGINIINKVDIKKIEKTHNKFIIQSEEHKYIADKLILATGTYAYYDFNSVNSYDLVASLKHNIIKPLPALVQLKINDKITKKWAGVRIYSKISLYQNDFLIKEEEGELMLTNYGLSGICAMQFSSIIARGLELEKKEELVINFVPTLASDISSMITFLDNYSVICSDRTVSQILDNILNYKLGNIIADDLQNKYYNDLSKKNKIKLASRLVSFRVSITGTNSYKDAQVCSGGVPIREINLKTMESLKINNLYIVGELLDVDGECGGYNLGFAWTTGIIAGSSAGDTND